MLKVALITCMLVFTGCLCSLIVTVQGTVAAIPTEIQATRADLVHQVEALRTESLAEIRRQLSPVVPMVDRQLTSLADHLDSQLSGTRADLVASLNPAIGAITGLQPTLRQTLQNLQGITEHANEASSVLFRRDALPAQLLGVLGGAKVTLGQAALTMRTVQEATPEFIAGVHQVVQNSNDTAAHSAAVMANLEAATKPLPKWLRIPLAITGAFAPTIAGAVSTAAATGAFK